MSVLQKVRVQIYDKIDNLAGGADVLAFADSSSLAVLNFAIPRRSIGVGEDRFYRHRDLRGQLVQKSIRAIRGYHLGRPHLCCRGSEKHYLKVVN